MAKSLQSSVLYLSAGFLLLQLGSCARTNGKTRIVENVADWLAHGAKTNSMKLRLASIDMQ